MTALLKKSSPLLISLSSAWLTRGGATALVLAGMLPGVAVLAGRGALGAWEGIEVSAETAAGPGDGAGAGLVLALGLQLVWAAPWLERLGASPRRARGATLLLGAALALGLIGPRFLKSSDSNRSSSRSRRFEFDEDEYDYAGYGLGGSDVGR